MAEGRDGEIIDPDHGANITATLEKLQEIGGEEVHPNLARVPKCPPMDSRGWTTNFSRLSCFTYRTLYKHFTERSEKEVEKMETATSRTAVLGCDGDTAEGSHSEGILAEDSESIAGQEARPPILKFRSFRGLDKGYRFYRDGHVQKIKLHMDVQAAGDQDKSCYVHCQVLPSTRKDRIYDVRQCCTVHENVDLSCDVRAAYCVCPADLAGSCNHVSALMYALEDFVRKSARGGR